MTDPSQVSAQLRTRLAAGSNLVPLEDGAIARALAALTPSGPIRVALNMINPLLVRQDAAGAMTGIAPDLARAIGDLLARDVTFVPLPTPAAVIGAIGTWDIAFMAMDRERATSLTFSEPYVRLGATFLVRSDADIAAPDDLNRADARIACPKGAAFAGWVRDRMTRATLLWDFQGDVGEALERGEISAAAGLRASLLGRTASKTKLSLLDSDFTAVEQAIAVPKANDTGMPLVEICLRQLRAGGAAHGIVARFATPGISLA